MKRFLAIVTALVLLSGCSLFSKDDPASGGDGQASSGGPAGGPPPSDFDGAMASMHEAWVQELIELLPEFDMPDKNETNFNLTGNVNVAGAGVVDFNASSAAKNDMSDSQNMKGDVQINVTAKLTPDASSPFPIMPSGTVSVELMSKVIGQKMFFSLSQFQLDMTEVPSEMIDPIISPFLGKWYGGSFDELEALMTSKGIPADFSQLKKGVSPKEILDIKEPIEKALKEFHIWKLKEAMPTENGMLRFKVELDRDKLEKGMIALMGAMQEIMKEKANLPKEALTQMERDMERAKRDIKNDLKDLSIEGVLSVSEKNSYYYTFAGDITVDDETGKIDVTWLEGERILSITGPDNENVTFEMTESGDEKKFTLEAKGNKILEGEKSPTKFKINAYEDNLSNDLSFSIDLTKNGDAYSGKIAIPEESVNIDVQKLIISKDKFELQTEIEAAGMKVFAGSVTWTMKEVSSVDIADPASSETFKQLFDQIEAAVASAMTTPAPPTPIPVEDLSGTVVAPVGE
jgi:hypothetical protein